MIVDLLRNDLGKVAQTRTVTVVERKRLVTLPTLHHLAGTVAATLRDGVGPADLLRATFPGGSITGCPKIRAMEIVSALEPLPSRRPIPAPSAGSRPRVT
jgi:para-aminobenzoate synthetase component 1